MGPSHPGDLVDPVGPRNRARVSKTSGRTRGPSDTSPSRPGLLIDPAGTLTKTRITGKTGRPRGISGTGPSPPGQPFEPTGPWNRTQVSQDSQSTPRTPRARTQVRVTQESWSTLRVFQPWPISPGTAGWTVVPWTQDRVTQGQWFEPAGPRTRPEYTRTACRTRRPSEPGPFQPGQQVDPEEPKTQAQVGQDIWLTL